MADYGGDKIIDVYDLDHKERVLGWFQHQNNQVEESSIGVSLLPEIMERVKTECGGVAPSVKGNLSILFSILNESQVFTRNMSWVGRAKSTAPSSLEGGGDNVMDVGKCLFVNVINRLCLLSYPSINISLKSLYPCRC